MTENARAKIVTRFVLCTVMICWQGVSVCVLCKEEFSSFKSSNFDLNDKESPGHPIKLDEDQLKEPQWKYTPITKELAEPLLSFRVWVIYGFVRLPQVWTQGQISPPPHRRRPKMVLLSTWTVKNIGWTARENQHRRRSSPPKTTLCGGNRGHEGTISCELASDETVNLISSIHYFFTFSNCMDSKKRRKGSPSATRQCSFRLCNYNKSHHPNAQIGSSSAIRFFHLYLFQSLSNNLKLNNLVELRTWLGTR